MLRDQETSRLRNAGHVDTRFNQLQDMLADLSSQLGQPPPLPAKDHPDAATSATRSQASAPSAPSSPTSSLSSSSSSSSSDTSDSEEDTSRPRTPDGASTDLDKLKIMMLDMLDAQKRTEQLVAGALKGGNTSDTRAPTLHRLEDLLVRLLVRSGDSEVAAEDGIDRIAGHRFDRHPSRSTETRKSPTESDTMSSQGTIRIPPAPPVSVITMDTETETGSIDRVPASLRSLTPGDPSIDESWEMHNLPPLSPELGPGRSNLVPPGFRMHSRGRQHPQLEPEYNPEQPMYEDEEPYERTPSPDPIIQKEQTPIEPVPSPIRPQRVPMPPRRAPSPSESTSEDSPQMRHARPGPPPQPLGLPSPVSSTPMPPFRPPFRPGFIPQMPFPPTMPRSSLPHFAQGREPMTTTYFRRGMPMAVPGSGLMGPVSCHCASLPDNMLTQAAQQLGPFMGGMRPGVPGFGGVSTIFAKMIFD